MPDITTQIIFSDDSKKLIDTFEADASLDHSYWNDPTLLALRLEVRDFYRPQQKFSCCYCKKDISVIGALNAQVEHIIPKSINKNFLFHPKNLCIICEGCNTSKGEKSTTKKKVHKKYPRSSNAFIIYHPHFDNYSEEIIVTNGIFYSGKTSKGRKTVEMCNLGRFHVALHEVEPELVNLKGAQELANILLTSTDAFEQTKALAKLGYIIQSNNK